MEPTPEVPHVRDRRTQPFGALPKQAQTWVLAGIAFLMLVIIMFTGHNPPKEHPAATAPVVRDPNQQAIQEYRARLEEQTQKLAAEEAGLARTKASLGAASAPPMAGPSGAAMAPVTAPPPVSALALEREKREYQSLFASNIALTYRPAASTGAPGVPEAAPGPTSASRKADTGASQAGPTAAGSLPKYRLFEGTVIETVLTNRLDASFSGPVNCMVTTNVYSPDETLVIPQGARVLGEVRKVEALGQQRLAVTFHRLLLPDGSSLSLDQFQGLDQVGETGLRDQVNHHYLQIFGVSLAIGAFAGLAQANTRYSVDESAANAYQQGVSNSLSQSALHILDRYLNVLPTFTIREGYRVKVYLSQDLMLPAYRENTAGPNQGDL